MARLRQDEGLILGPHLFDAVKAATPMRDMVGFAGNRAERQFDVRQADRLAEHREGALGKAVLLAQPAQVLQRHLGGQVGAVAVPVEQIEGGRGLTHHVAFDRGLVDQVVRAQERERPAHEGFRQNAVVVGLPFDAVDEIIVQEHANLARIRKIGQRGEEGRGLDRLVARFLQMRQGQAQRGASDAIAHRVDLFLAGDAAHLGHRRQIAFADVIIHADIGVRRIRVDPGHHEQRKALIHDPFDQAVLRFQIHHIELVDPRRKDQQGRLVDGFGGGGILDQLEHAVAIDHRTGGRGDILANVERLAVGQRYQQFAVIRLDVADQIFQPLHQTCAIGLDRFFQRVGVGAKEIRRRHHVDDLAGEIFHAALVARIDGVHRLHGIVNSLGVQLILLLEVVEGGMGFPQRVGKAAVLRAGVGRSLEFARGQRLLRLDIMFQGLAPIAYLILKHLGRVLHHRRDIGGGGLHVDVIAGALHAGV